MLLLARGFDGPAIAAVPAPRALIPPFIRTRFSTERKAPFSLEAIAASSSSMRLGARALPRYLRKTVLLLS